MATESDGVTAQLFKLEGEKESILASIISLPSETWFFKLNTLTSELDEIREPFTTFLTSVHFGSATAPPATASILAPEQPGIGLDVPDGWKKSEGSSMRVASFSIPGNGGPDGDVSVIPLGGDSGTIFENVNRWRGQLRLPDLESDEDPALGNNLDGVSGPVFITHMVSEEALFEDKKLGAMSTGVIKKGDTTWFFKLLGEAELIAKNREKFEAFVLSAKIP